MGRDRRGLSAWYHDYVLYSFDSVIAATAKDKFFLETRYKLDQSKIEAFDFRLIQIAKRLQNYESTLPAAFLTLIPLQAY